MIYSLTYSNNHRRLKINNSVNKFQTTFNTKEIISKYFQKVII